MLATWLRLTRPDAVDGAVAASAPVLSFEAEAPPCDATFYARGVSFDVSPAAGASAAGDAAGASVAGAAASDAAGAWAGGSAVRSQILQEECHGADRVL